MRFTSRKVPAFIVTVDTEPHHTYLGVVFAGFEETGMGTRPAYSWSAWDGCGLYFDSHTEGQVHGGVNEEPDTRRAMAALLSFFGAAAEAYGATVMRGQWSDNAGPFAHRVMEWAYCATDALATLEMELEEAR